MCVLALQYAVYKVTQRNEVNPRPLSITFHVVGAVAPRFADREPTRDGYCQVRRMGSTNSQ